MSVAVLGLNHKTAPVALRETVSIEAEALPRVLKSMIERGAHEAAILSTCNRTEMYVVAHDEQEARNIAWETFVRLGPGGEPSRALADALYYYTNAEAARHLFMVASGLDSLVVGEAQVLGQVKRAFDSAWQAGTTGPIISQLFHLGVRVGKRTRSETRISEGAVSISYAAVELARRVFPSLEGTQVLLVGAGKMAELAAKNLADRGPSILVANRTWARSRALATAIGGEPVGFEELDELLGFVDIVLTSTGARTPILTVDAVTGAMRRRGGKPLFMIDIAVPRDIDPAVARVPGVKLYNIDDLKAVVEANMTEREQAVHEAMKIVDEETDRFDSWLHERVAAPVIKALREKVSQTAEREVDRVLRRLEHLPEYERAQVRALARSITGKILHHPTIRLKSSVEEGTHRQFFDSVSQLFGLDLDELYSGRANGRRA